MAIGNPRRKGKLIIGVTLLYTAGLICFALSRSFALALAIVFLLGWSMRSAKLCATL